MKLLVINNLASGYGEGAIYDFMRSFAADGDDICMRCTNGTTPISTLLDDAKDFDAVIAAGGDGVLPAGQHRHTRAALPRRHGQPAGP